HAEDATGDDLPRAERVLPRAALEIGGERPGRPLVRGRGGHLSFGPLPLLLATAALLLGSVLGTGLAGGFVAGLAGGFVAGLVADLAGAFVAGFASSILPGLGLRLAGLPRCAP